MNEDKNFSELHSAVMRLSGLCRVSLDALETKSFLSNLDCVTPTEALNRLAQHSFWPEPQWATQPDEAKLPCIFFENDNVGLVVGRRPDKKWVVEFFENGVTGPQEKLASEFSSNAIFSRIFFSHPNQRYQDSFLGTVLQEILTEKRTLAEITTVSIVIGVLALTTSVYTMQIYDRVIPTSAYSTLLVLSIGMVIALVLDLIGKWSRSSQSLRLIDAVDQRLARITFARLLAIRLDQLPQSVGSMSARVRGYETVRSFLVLGFTLLLVDLPISFALISVVWLIGGWLALFPFAFLLVGIIVSVAVKTKLEKTIRESLHTQQLKTGLLVESIEGAEIIKSGNAGWRFLSKWLDITDTSRQFDHSMQITSDRAQLSITSLQQLCYVAIVANGAVLVGIGDITMGGLIACTILSSRAMSPLAGIPSMLIRWSQVKAAASDIENLWKVHGDHAKGQAPVILEAPKGKMELRDVEVRNDETSSLRCRKLVIKQGERVGIIGSIGSGKSTLLRVLSGMYKPSTGIALLDDLDLSTIAKASLAETLAYVPQDGRLFSGSLRENLVLGSLDPGDEKLMEISEKTGLRDAVLRNHPLGFDRPIYEGGTGLSGGQRQLVHLTRAFLRQPKVWLLDEPTSSMDLSLETHVVQTIKENLDANPRTTFIVATHKPQVLSLVDRIIVLANGEIKMDGPKEEIVESFKKPTIIPLGNRQYAKA